MNEARRMMKWDQSAKDWREQLGLVKSGTIRLEKARLENIKLLENKKFTTGILY